jgi:OHCU decarboxylase
MSEGSYPREMVGYGRTPPYAGWPGDARIALQFVINYEEGGENNILHGDAASEAFLSEIVGAAPWPGQRHMNMESIYEYGSRAGFWRLHRMFTQRDLPVTVFAVAMAMARNPEAVAAMKEAGWEIASHGYKWIDYRDTPKEVEAQHIAQAIAIHTQCTGERPLGFYQGRTSIDTVALAMGEGGFVYCADSYADDLPYAEGATAPKMLSIGLHCRLVGRPGRAAALARFLDYVLGHDKVWVATRLDIARRWIRHHPPAGGWKPSKLGRTLFVERFGGVYEHSPWVAASAHDGGLGVEANKAEGLAAAMRRAMAAGSHEAKLALINAHPDLAGALALSKRLTAESTGEQAGAGLDALSADELARFTRLNDSYRVRFGFPFIMAVKGKTKADILAAFEQRLTHDKPAEFATALAEIDRIAALRLMEILP